MGTECCRASGRSSSDFRGAGSLSIRPSDDWLVKYIGLASQLLARPAAMQLLQALYPCSDERALTGRNPDG